MDAMDGHQPVMVINRSARRLKVRQNGCHTQTNCIHLGGPGCASVGPPSGGVRARQGEAPQVHWK